MFGNAGDFGAPSTLSLVSEAGCPQVDAVLWIDYAKAQPQQKGSDAGYLRPSRVQANQPPGSFKMGPRESRPFSPAHMQARRRL